MRRKLSKLALAVSFGLALAFTFSCSSDGDDERDTLSSSSAVAVSSSSSSVHITEAEACDSYWRQVMNEIAGQCNKSTISISRSPSSSQTYGYDCSITQADVNETLKAFCTPSSTCDLGCVDLFISNSTYASRHSWMSCSDFFARSVTQIASTCKCTITEVEAKLPCR